MRGHYDYFETKRRVPQDLNPPVTGQKNLFCNELFSALISDMLSNFSSFICKLRVTFSEALFFNKNKYTLIAAGASGPPQNHQGGGGQEATSIVFSGFSC